MSELLNQGMRDEARRQGIDVLETYWQGRDAVAPYTPPQTQALPAPTIGQDINRVVSDLSLPILKVSALAAAVSTILGFGTAAAAGAAAFVSANTGAVVVGIACVSGLLIWFSGRGVAGEAQGGGVAAGDGVKPGQTPVNIVVNVAGGDVNVTRHGA
jgi:hypothetical protein